MGGVSGGAAAAGVGVGEFMEQQPMRPQQHPEVPVIDSGFARQSWQLEVCR